MMKSGNNTILIAEDEMRIRRMLSDFFKSNGYAVLEAQDGQEALDIFYRQMSKIDLILLDVMMPYKNGFDVLKEIREASLVPVIMLTAKSEEYDQLNGFKKGADDYIAKPFSPTLLLARVEAVLKRTGKNKDAPIIVGSIMIDYRKQVVECEGCALDLTPKEYDLLSYLVQNQEIVVSRESILNQVWNYDYIGDVRTVDTHIKQLRAKLGKKGQYIKTVHGRGYRFEACDDKVD
ncbi:MAG: response regulator transcription factor [Cellulosilyticaceae bacterium]